MTEAGWTSKRPAVAGWYWWRSLNGMIGPEIIQIDNTNGPDTDLEVVGPFGETPLDEWIADSDDEPGEWLGPLSPDDRQQGRVEGAQEYRDAVIQELHLDDAARQEFTRTDVVLALAHADEQLAQQAQGGCDEQNLRR